MRSLQHAPVIISINTGYRVANGSVYKSIQLDLGLTSITYVHTSHRVDCSQEYKHIYIFF